MCGAASPRWALSLIHIDSATICVSAGRRGLEVELSPGDLTELTHAVLAPIGRA